MHADELARIPCPRCTAPLDPRERGCTRCGLELEPRGGGVFVQASGPACPRCDRLAEPGTRFVGVTGRSEHGSCEHCGTPLVLPDRVQGMAYEEQSLACDAYELEQLARAQSVDGWRLLDTTVDAATPNRIVAHFRRPVRLTEPERAAEARRARRHRPPEASSARARRAARSDGGARRSSPRDARSRARAARLEAIEARRAAKAAAAVARAEAHRRRHAARVARIEARRRRHAARGGRRGPALRHATGAWQGGATALAGLLAFALHMALFVSILALRYVAIPMAILALRLAQAVLLAILDELWLGLGRGPRGPRRYHRRGRVRWV